MRRLLFALALLAACGPDVNVNKGRIDNDNDGYTPDVDCDDAHATVNPDAPEICDGLDNDCDGGADVDATDARTFYADADGDGFGDAGAPLLACERPTGAVEDATDCDDADAAVFPGNDEVCDGLDNDCNGEVDDDPSDLGTFYVDADGDGYGDPGTAVQACEAGAGDVTDGTDCDDDDAAIHPDAVEEDCADPTDYNCDGSVGYADADGDGSPACDDCDDTDGARAPTLVEVCDGADVDEDCDGQSDDDDASTDAATFDTWYADRDGDAYGDASRAVHQCDAPADHVANGDDCEDTDAARNPGAAEVCDAADLDEDCDGLSDDADSSVTGGATWYADADADGYGGDTTVSACDPPSGYLATSTDCDDTSAAISPAATEVCDAANVDEDCDGAADDTDTSATGKATWYQDADGDGHAGPTTASACDQPTGYLATSTDCDDTSAAISPAATEVCDAANVDEDCDGVADDADTSASGKATWYRDADGDGHAGTTTASACDQPTGYLATSTDCDDTSAAISPAATEVCDAANVDEDCDGAADDADTSASGKATWYRDADGDGYAGTTTTSACDQPGGHLATSADCDDTDVDTHPAAAEVCDDGVDNDCADGDEVCPVPGYAGAYPVDSDYDTKIYGVAEDDYFAIAMVAGDFDGDGAGDLVVSASDNVYSTRESTVYGYYGPFDAGARVATDGDDFLYYNTSTTYAGFYGQALWNVGDVDGDGKHDLLVSAATTGTAITFLYPGGDVGPSAFAPYDDDGPYSCTDAAPAGNFDATSPTDEWLCGNASYSSSTGRVYVYAGDTDIAYLRGESTYDSAGRAVAGGGDVNGDGFDDVWVGAFGDDDTGTDAGAVYLVHAPVAGSLYLSDADAKLRGAARDDRLGHSLRMPGDVDGDGYDDVIAAAYFADTSALDAGALYVVTDPSTGVVPSSASATILGEHANDVVGNWGFSTGDLDGDGRVDLIVPVPPNDDAAADAGAVYVVYGPLTGTMPLASADATFLGADRGDELGYSSAIVPDTDGDGKDEIAMGSYRGSEGAYADRGAVWIFNGR